MSVIERVRCVGCLNKIGGVRGLLAALAVAALALIFSCSPVVLLRFVYLALPGSDGARS